MRLDNVDYTLLMEACRHQAAVTLMWPSLSEVRSRWNEIHDKLLLARTEYDNASASRDGVDRRDNDEKAHDARLFQHLKATR